MIFLGGGGGYNIQNFVEPLPLDRTFQLVTEQMYFKIVMVHLLEQCLLAILV